MRGEGGMVDEKSRKRKEGEEGKRIRRMEGGKGRERGRGVKRERRYGGESE